MKCCCSEAKTETKNAAWRPVTVAGHEAVFQKENPNQATQLLRCNACLSTMADPLKRTHQQNVPELVTFFRLFDYPASQKVK